MSVLQHLVTIVAYSVWGPDPPWKGANVEGHLPAHCRVYLACHRYFKADFVRCHQQRGLLLSVLAHSNLLCMCVLCSV